MQIYNWFKLRQMLWKQRSDLIDNITLAEAETNGVLF
jgi:hypothetical protein